MMQMHYPPTSPIEFYMFPAINIYLKVENIFYCINPTKLNYRFEFISK